MSDTDELDDMPEEVDFSDSVPNPYVNRVPQRKTVTMNMDERVIAYFKEESHRTGIPYQNIINMYLLQCVEEQKHIKLA